MHKILSWLQTKWIIFVIVALGLFLRLYGYNWGTPLLLHPDEPVIVDQARDLIKRNSWEPLKFYGTPDQLSIYSLSLVYRVLGPSHEPQFYYYTGRILTAIIGTLTIVVVYLIGAEFSFLTGLLNALLFAVFPVYVMHAHYVTPDVPITFLATLVIYLLIKYIKSHNQKYIWIATIISALSVTEKYPAVANFGMVGLVYILTNKEKIWKFLLRGLGLVLGFALTLFAAAPFLFIRYQRTLTWIKNEARTEHSGVQILGFFGNLHYYAGDFYTNGGLILSIFTFIGVIIAIKVYKMRVLPLFLGFIYWVGLSAIALHWSRWGLPMYLSPLLFSSLALAYLISKLRRTQLHYILLFLLFISLLAQLLVNRVNLLKLASKSTQIMALKYLKDNDITKNNTLYEGYTPLGDGNASNTKYDLKELENKKFKYVILSSNMYGRYIKEDKNGQYKKNIDFYNVVTKKKLLKQFQSKCTTIAYKSKIPEVVNFLSAIDHNCIPGPELKIYAL